MIFITLGSQKFQFNRLLMEIDKLIKDGIITEEVFAQSGYSDYIPKNYEYKQFLDKNKFDQMMEKSRLIISHGGTGAIVGALKKEKKVISIARLQEFGEHVDNHQIEIVNMFDDMKFIIGISDINDLKDKISEIEKIEFKRYVSNTHNIIESINDFIENKK